MTIEELTAKLIGYKTISGNHAEVLKGYKFIRKYLGKKYYTKIFEYNKFLSLLISNSSNTSDFDVLFNGHFDVVSDKDENFVARIDGDKLYGRGSIDMKGQLATILHMLANNDFDKKVGFLITSDEEIGGHNGTELFLKNNHISSKLVIVPDAGENFTFVDSEKALLQIDIVANGVSAHASRPQDGHNAILNAIDIYTQLCTKYDLDPNAAANDKISINLSIINSGDLYNKVPDQCAMSLDIRYRGYKQKAIEKELQQICKSHNAIYSIHQYAEEFRCNLKSPEVAKFSKAASKVLQREISHIDEDGASDIHYFSNANLPAVSINPEGYNLHGDGEYVVISSLYTLQKIFLEYLK